VISRFLPSLERRTYQLPRTTRAASCRGSREIHSRQRSSGCFGLLLGQIRTGPHHRVLNDRNVRTRLPDLLHSMQHSSLKQASTIGIAEQRQREASRRLTYRGLRSCQSVTRRQSTHKACQASCGRSVQRTTTTANAQHTPHSRTCSQSQRNPTTQSPGLIFSGTTTSSSTTNE
jgi:hypothetical protein